MQIEDITQPSPPTIDLKVTLTPRELVTLIGVFGMVGGSPEGPRGVVNELLRSLEKIAKDRLRVYHIYGTLMTVSTPEKGIHLVDTWEYIDRVLNRIE